MLGRAGETGGAPAAGGAIGFGAATPLAFCNSAIRVCRVRRIAGIRDATTGIGNAVNVVIDSNGQLGTVSSSRRSKFEIGDMADATDGLMRLRPVTFRYLKHGDNAPLQYGLIAEEVAEVYPELVARNKDG